MTTRYLRPEFNVKDLLTPLKRILTYAGPAEYLMQAIALVAAIGSGAGIALQNLIFGEFITIITDYTSGVSEPSKFRKDVADLA